ncbi:MAG: signal recognition particle protein [Pseudomonadota bacterium]
MLETITKGFKNARLKLQGKAELSEENIDEALRDVRVSLLEGDVEFNVVKTFLSRVKDKALGKVVDVEAKDKSGKLHKLGAGERFIKICYEELEGLMGPVDTSINIGTPITKIMMVGLQGSGKTTTAGKLCKYLLDKKYRPMLVAADVYRPAAIDQLQVLGEQLGVHVYTEDGVMPPELCERAIQRARERQCNVVIFDTAGRLSIDETLMQELVDIEKATRPDNTFLVCDAMIGQDAVRTAEEFSKKLALHGFILTKLDGDARGGAALSIKEVTGKPIKFLGMGETLDKLEEFRPAGLASRILGMGDVVGLVQDFEGVVDEDKAEKDAMRMLRGQFSLEDFVEQIRTLRKMGSLSDLVEKIPFFSDMVPEGTKVDDKELVRLEAMVSSMTKEERRNPGMIDDRRKKRIAAGSGRKVKELDELLMKHKMMRQMMQTLGQAPGLLAKLPGFKQMAGLKQMQGADLSALFGTSDPFGPGGMRPLAPPPGYYATTRAGAGKGGKASKGKKKKRQAERTARKKSRR